MKPFLTLRFARYCVITLVGTAIPVTFNACGQVPGIKTLELPSTLSVETLAFSRAGLPEAVQSTVTLSGTCSEGLALSIQVADVSPALSVTCVNGNFSQAILLPGADGPKVIVGTSIASDGREIKDSVTVSKDTRAPVISVLNVAPKDSFMVISGTCESGLAIAVSGDVLSAGTATCTNGLFQVSANISTGVGIKSVTISQTDAAGNRGTGTYGWTPDSVPPALVISAPMANAVVGNSVMAAGVCEPGLIVNVSGTALAQAAQLSCAMGSFSSNLVINGGDGEKTLVFSQTDTSGNKTDVTVNIRKDTIAPSLTLTAPLTNATVTSDAVMVSGACETGLQVMVQGAGVSAQRSLACINSAYSSNVILSSGNGQKVIEVTQTDLAGNQAGLSRTVTKTAPTSSLTILLPVANSVSRGTMTISGNCDSSATVAFTGDIMAVSAVICSGGVFSRALTLSDGDGLKNIVVSQTFNNVVSQASQSIMKDTTVPVLTLIQPAVNATVNGNVIASGTCESGLSVEYSGAGLSAASSASCNNGSFSSIITMSAGNGSKTFSVTQTDAAGNTATVSRMVARDSSGSTVTIVAPVNNTPVKASVSINGQCATGTAVILAGSGLNSSMNAICSLGIYSQSVTLTSGDGAKVITATQTDLAGNVSTATVTVSKDTLAPQLTITAPASGALAESGLTVQGACENGLSVTASGSGVASAVSATCVSQSYALSITFSVGNGTKDVVISSADAAGNVSSVSRQFTRGSSIPMADFNAAKAVMTQYCNSCHMAGGQASNMSFQLSTEAEFISKGFVVAGDPDQSKLIYRMLHYNGPTSGGLRSMPKGYDASSFPLSAYNTLVSWVRQMQSPGPGTGTTPAFDCTDPAARSNSLSYILTKTQYQNTISDLFGASVSAAISGQLSILPADTFDPNSNARQTALSMSKVEAYSNMATGIATAVMASSGAIRAVFGNCANGSAPNTTCIDTYLTGATGPTAAPAFAKKIFRRPLTASEITYAKGIANRGGDYKANLQTLLALHLQLPSFIWRLEVGTGTTELEQFTLTPYEIATRLAYMTTDSTPDDELIRAADQNKLANVTDIKGQVLRLIQTARGKDKLRANIMRWSMTGSVQDFTQLPALLKQDVQTNGLGQAMVDETITYIDKMVFEQKTSYRTLLTSKTSYASSPTLAQIYGHSPVTSPSMPASFPEGDRRQGLLMRSQFFTTPYSRTGIIRRGVNFQKRILCNEIPPPSSVVADIREAEAFSMEEALLHTNREGVTKKTSQPLCMTCHATINPTGFAFENFDPFGRVRSVEPIFGANGELLRSLPVDTNTQVPLASGGTLQVQDAFDLVSFVANSDEGSACFSRNIFRFVNEKRETTADYCALDKVQKIVGDPSKSILDAMVELIANDAILVKKNN